MMIPVVYHHQAHLKTVIMIQKNKIMNYLNQAIKRKKKQRSMLKIKMIKNLS